MTRGLRTTQMLDKTDKDRSKRRNRMMKVIIKMFFVMGLTWIADMISWAIEVKFGAYEIFKNHKGFLYSGLVFQIINSSQGIIMFLVVFFDTARIKMLREMLCPSKIRKTSVFYAEDPSAGASSGGGCSTSVTNISSRKTSNASERETRM